MRRRHVLAVAGCAGLLLALTPALAQAHGIGAYYALPIPLHYYLLGAGYAVAASFVMLTVLLPDAQRPPAPPRRLSLAILPAVIMAVRAGVGTVVVVLMGAGFWGTRNPVENLAPWLFWVFLLVGLTLMSLLIGNAWERVNPWRFVVEAVERLDPVPQRRHASAWLGPIALFLLFWWELVSRTSFLPGVVASILFGYTLITIIGGRLFENWFTDVDPLSVLFRLVGSISPLCIEDGDRGLVFLPWTATSFDATSPLLLASGVLLGGASFDSLQESVLWFDWLRALRVDTVDPLIWGTAGLLGTVAFFVGCYLLAIYAMSLVVGDARRWRTFVLPFVWSLIPVAVGYTLAHNFPITVLVLPNIVAVASDPFRVGWDLFGTASFNPGLILGARTVWFVEIALVILGHIGGVWLAHLLALRVLRDGAIARRSQYPMALLMVGYTALTLWLLAQPLVVSP